ncbi:hypothetical protein ABZ871_19480 [Streptomyces populi]
MREPAARLVGAADSSTVSHRERGGPRRAPVRAESPETGGLCIRRAVARRGARWRTINRSGPGTTNDAATSRDPPTPTPPPVQHRTLPVTSSDEPHP